jgi:peptidoglycan/LPS O-acetylase OafA/YrhL
MNERRYDIDWLRVIAMLAVFLFHCSGFFTPLDWHLKNAQRSEILLPVVAWMDLWMMPIFFLLSGFGSWYSLKSRSGRRYIWERFTRLLVPFFVVGAFLLLPPQYYIDKLTHRGYVYDFWDYFPPYWDGTGSFQFRFDEPYLTNIWPGHLWFLEFLFIVSVVTLPVIIFLRRDNGKRLVTWLAEWTDRWGGIYLFLVPLIVVRIAMRSTFHGEHSWADLGFYGVVFLIGAFFAGDPRFLESCKRHTWSGLVLGILAFASEIVFVLQFRYPYPGTEHFSGKYVLFQVVMSIGIWSWMVFLLGLASRYLNINNRARVYASDFVLPFYLLHQTVILIVGWYIIPLEWAILPKYLVISIGSFALIMGIYEVLIRRINPVRFLFGMRVKGRGLFVQKDT